MAGTETLDLKSTALLALDFQNGIVGFVPGASHIFKPAAETLDAARKASVSIIHVGLGFRPGYPEITSNHPIFERVRQGDLFLLGSESSSFHNTLSPLEGEIIVIKHRVSAFSGNDLEMILRSQGIKTLIFFGISTSGIVLSTLRQASDLDFQCVVVKDACFDSDDEVHRVLTEKVFPRQARVVTTERITKEFQTGLRTV